MATAVDERAVQSRRSSRLVGRLCGFAAASLGLGAAGGVLWWLIVKPPAYQLNSGGAAATSERGLSQFIAGDAWFCAIGLVVGLLIGLAAWHWLRDLGWSVVLVVLVCATASALTELLQAGVFDADPASGEPDESFMFGLELLLDGVQALVDAHT